MLGVHAQGADGSGVSARGQRHGADELHQRVYAQMKPLPAQNPTSSHFNQIQSGGLSGGLKRAQIGIGGSHY